MVLLVTFEDNQLKAQLTGQPKFPIYPTSNDEFIWKVVEAKVKFVTDEKGMVTHAIHNQNGTRIEARRLQDPTPVKVDPAVFDKYVGKYDVGGNFIIEVTKDGDKLMAQGTNLPKYQLLPSSEIDYYALEISVKLTFQMTDGKVTSMLLSFNGAEKAAMRIID